MVPQVMSIVLAITLKVIIEGVKRSEKKFAQASLKSKGIYIVSKRFINLLKVFNIIDILLALALIITIIDIFK